MSLDNETVSIYSGGLTGGSSYTIIPNSYKNYVIPSTGVTAVFDIILPKLYDNSVDISSFRILNYSSFDKKLKYIANATDAANGTLTIFTTVKSKSSIIVDGINQAHNILDSSNIDSSGGGPYLPLSDGTINGNLTVSAKAAGSNYGPTMIIDGSSIRSHGKISINGTVVSAMLSDPVSDLDIYQSENLSLSSSAKTAGIRLYALGAGPIAGTSYFLGINRSGGLTLFKTTGTTVDILATFDTDGGIDTILQKTPTPSGGGGQIANKTYVDTRYVIPLISVVPDLISNSSKNWTVSATSELSNGWLAYNAFSSGGSEWAVNGTAVGSVASITVGTAIPFVLGGFGIASRSSSPGSNNLPTSWTISGATSSSGPFTTLYTGAATITSTFSYFEVDFRAISSGGAPSLFKYFKYSGLAGGVGDWGMAKFELYAATPISFR